MQSDDSQRPDPSGMRVDYRKGALRRKDLNNDALEQFRAWFSEAAAGGVPEPNAMSLATSDGDGAVTVRTVLLKAFDEGGFVFFTNFLSHKGRQIAANPQVALLFPWITQERQVCVTGSAAKISEEEARAYFVKRPFASRIGAWASSQSEVIPSRAFLEEKFDEAERKFADGNVPLPEYWGGYRVEPATVEFWQGSSGRLHDRFRYTKTPQGWHIERLSP